MLRTVQNLLSTCWLWISGGFQVDLQYFTVRRDRPCAGWGDAARSCEPTWFHVNGGRTPTDHEQNCLGHVDCKHSSTQEFYSGRNFATLSIETWSICTIILLDELECPRYIGFHFMNLSPGHRMWWRGRRPHTKSWRWACESEIITVLCLVQSCERLCADTAGSSDHARSSPWHTAGTFDCRYAVQRTCLPLGILTLWLWTATSNAFDSESLAVIPAHCCSLVARSLCIIILLTNHLQSQENTRKHIRGLFWCSPTCSSGT